MPWLIEARGEPRFPSWVALVVEAPLLLGHGHLIDGSRDEVRRRMDAYLDRSRAEMEGAVAEGG